MYYSPENPREGENGADDEDSDEELLPPRVKIERIYELLRRCVDIEVRTYSFFILQPINQPIS
jgi:hypothetical protein